MKIVINGRFLTQNITGVQRVAQELIRELDRVVKKEELIILTPKNIIFNELQYKNIEIKKVGLLKGHLWEQIELPFYTLLNKRKLLNLCNTAPVINTGIVMIHDVSTKANPQFFSKKFSLFYKVLNKIITKTSSKILTVSEFSKEEIIKFYKVKPEKIEVVFNGWQHLNRIIEDEKIIEKFKLKDKEFYLGVSSINPNKNFKYIIELAKLYPEKLFVIAGKLNEKVFGNMNLENFPNLIWTGYITDEELKALYKNTIGFVYPSLYEGFGIPPLEALASGCRNIYISNTSCLPEIFGESVFYLNPYKVEKILDKNKNIEKEKIKRVLEKYSWKQSAEKILKILKEENQRKEKNE